MDDPHSQPLPDAPPKRRFGSWTKLGGGALTFAILLHVLALTIAGICIYRVVGPPPPVIFVPGDPPGKPPTKTPSSLKPSPLAPSNDINRIVTNDPGAAHSLPEPGDNSDKMTSIDALPGGGLPGGIGNPAGRPGDGNSVLIHDGNKNKPPFITIPPTWGKRCSQNDRLLRLKENGGTPACEEAVMKGLRWLKANQQPNGSWGGANPTAMTGLALLAYFGHCETTTSEEFGESCLKAITYLVNLGMQNNGRIGTDMSAQPFCYEHAIATYALAEATTFCKDLKPELPNLKEITEQAGQFIIDNQSTNGAWAYGYNKSAGGDVSVVGWQIQALKACSHTGIKFRGMTPCINKGLDYLVTCQNDNGGFGYNGPGGPAGNHEYFTLTGVGMLCNQMWDKNKAAVRKGASYVLKNTKFDYNGECCDLYGHYYESQAMIQRSRADWQKYNDLFRDQVLNNQDSDGSWKVPGGGKKIRGNENIRGDKVYRSTLCILMLEVYYRFLGTAGDAGGGAGERTGI